jgi:hypothetical protein
MFTTSRRLAFLSILLLGATPALAAPITVVLQNHRFTPSVIKVKANQPSLIKLINKDATADEFDSAALKVEKVVPGHGSGMIRLRALAPGKYPFMGEYHADTAKGVVIAE